MVRPRLLPLLLMLFFVTAVTAEPARAQTSTATLHGTITDPSGGVLPGVTVSLQSPSTGLRRDAVTNEAGLYVFNFLPSGEYSVSAELTGFKGLRHDSIRLEIGQNRELDIKLEVGQVEETVTVEGTASVLDARQPRSGR